MSIQRYEFDMSARLKMMPYLIRRQTFDAPAAPHAVNERTDMLILRCERFEGLRLPDLFVAPHGRRAAHFIEYRAP